jgi:predicted SprT family Zn-dependent metalloprotease
MDTFNPLLKPWRIACGVWPELEAHKPPTFKISERLTRTAGLCYMESGEIILSGPYLREYRREMMGEILTHETAHYIDYCLNGWRKYKRHHGKPWQEIMYTLGYEPKPFHTMELK